MNRRITELTRRLSPFKRVVVWGHPLHSHTHSYVHQAFFRAFRALGRETIWTDDPRALDGVALAGTLFVSEGQVIDGMPLRRDCHYVLHNVESGRFAQVADRVLALQTVTLDVRERHLNGAVEKRNEYTFVERDGGGPVTLHQPWATDLLPHEFDFELRFPAPWPKGMLRATIRARRNGLDKAVWVGTIGEGLYGNAEELAPFRRACEEASLAFIHRAIVDRSEHIRLIRSSLVAPAIVGRWQLEHAYIPCRIFKNISYGRLGLTNSPWVQGIFESDVLCQADTADLLWMATNFARRRDPLLAQMREVQDRHTYVNRIETIVDCLP